MKNNKLIQTSRWFLGFLFALLLGISLAFSIQARPAPTERLSLRLVFGDQFVQDVSVDQILEFGTKVRFDQPIGNEYEFAYWVVNGIVRPELEYDYEFTVPSELSLTAFFTKANERIALFADAKSRLLGYDYVTLGQVASEPIGMNIADRPGYIERVDQFRWRTAELQYLSQETGSITENRVYVLVYTIDASNAVATGTYTVTLDSATFDMLNPDDDSRNYSFNQVATVYALEVEDQEFSHFENADGIILSYQNPYRFTVARNMTVKAVYVESQESQNPLITMDDPYLFNENGILYFLSRIEFDQNDYELIEYGVLYSNRYERLTVDSTGVVREKGTTRSANTGGYVLALDDAIQSARAYMIVLNKDSGEFEYFYSVNVYLNGTTFDDEATLYTITFENLSGGNHTNRSEFTNLDEFQLLPAERNGFVFLGWYLSEEGFAESKIEQVDFGTDENLTIYAKWREVQYQVLFDTNGGNYYQMSIQAPFGTTIYETSIPEPTKAGYDFVGWFTHSYGVGYAEDSIFENDGSFELESNFTAYAVWEAIEYSIVFDSNGGSSIDPITQGYRTSVSAPSDPTKTGYTFAGWYANSGLTTPYVFNKMPLNGTTVYAKWTLNPYSISFDTNGGSSVDNIEANFGTSISAPADPDKDGYTFGGWYSDEELESEYTFNTMPAFDQTLYAKWIAIEYTITFESNGGSAVNDLDADYGDIISAPSNPTKTGYTFAGWYSDSALTAPFSFSTMPLYGATLYAKWTINNYTITVNLNGGTGVDNITQAYLSSVSQPNDPTRTGHTFVGWYSNVGLTTPYVFGTMPLNGTTIYAKWSVNTYIITFEKNGGTGIEELQSPYNALISAPANPTKSQFVFQGWFADEELTIPYVFSTGLRMPDRHFTLYAKWTPVTYTITYVLNAGSESLTNSNPSSYSHLSAFDFVSPDHKTGYDFDGWYDNAQFNGNAITSITFGSTGDVTLYAKWTAIDYDIDYELDGGTNSISNVDSYTVEDVITLYAPSKTGYDFDGWYDNAQFNGNAITSITLGSTGDVTLYAKFTIKTFTVTFYDESGINVLKEETVEYGFNATAPVTNPTKASTSAYDYSFSGWDKSYTNITGDRDIYPDFDETPISFTITYNTNNGTLSGQYDQSYTYESIVTLPIPTRNGYVFLGWYDNAQFIGNAITSIGLGNTGNASFYAKWEIGYFTIFFDNNGGFGINWIRQIYNSAVNAPINPEFEGYTFLGWYLASNDLNYVEGEETPFSFDGLNMPYYNTYLIAKWAPEVIFTAEIYILNEGDLYVDTFDDITIPALIDALFDHEELNEGLMQYYSILFDEDFFDNYGRIYYFLHDIDGPVSSGTIESFDDLIELIQVMNDDEIVFVTFGFYANAPDNDPEPNDPDPNDPDPNDPDPNDPDPNEFSELITNVFIMNDPQGSYDGPDILNTGTLVNQLLADQTFIGNLQFFLELSDVTFFNSNSGRITLIIFDAEEEELARMTVSDFVVGWNLLFDQFIEETEGGVTYEFYFSKSLEHNVSLQDNMDGTDVDVFITLDELTSVINAFLPNWLATPYDQGPDTVEDLLKGFHESGEFRYPVIGSIQFAVEDSNQILIYQTETLFDMADYNLFLEWFDTQVFTSAVTVKVYTNYPL